MAYDGAAWNEATPTNATLANEIDDVARDIKLAVRSRLAHEHVMPSSQTATSEGGIHSHVTLKALTASPAIVVGTNTQAGSIYASSGTHPVLTHMRSAGYSVAMLPTGIIWPFAGSAPTIPVGFYACTGGAISRTTDAALFAVVGTFWGSGDGSTTFNVPDLRGRTLVGQSGAGIFATIGGTTGAVTHQLTIAEMPAHTHTYNQPTSTTAPSGAGVAAYWDGNKVSTNSGSTGGDGAHNNVQPSAVVLYIIAR